MHSDKKSEEIWTRNRTKKIQQKLGQEIRPKIGQKKLDIKSDKNGTKNWPKILVKKLVGKIEQNIKEEIRQKNGEAKSNKNRLRRIKLTFILYKVSQDKLNKNSHNYW